METLKCVDMFVAVIRNSRTIQIVKLPRRFTVRSDPETVERYLARNGYLEEDEFWVPVDTVVIPEALQYQVVEVK